MGHFLGKVNGLTCDFNKKNLSIPAKSIIGLETLFASLLLKLQKFSVVKVASIKSSELSM